MRPRWGLRPNSPHADDGTRIEPPPSEPSAPATIPAATAAALPPLDPPVLRCGSHGLRVAPQVCDSVSWGHRASSGMFVWPTTIAPAARRRRTTSQSAAAGSLTTPVPCVVSSPATSMLSLTAIGTPSSGAARPWRRRACAASASASARSARTARKALTAGSRRAMRSRLSSTSSRAVTVPERTSSACRAMPA